MTALATTSKIELVIYPNPLDYQEKIVVETDNVVESLMEYFGDRFPQNAELFHGQISESTCVTPHFDGAGFVGDNTVEKLMELEGRIYCIVKAEFFLFGLFGGTFGNLFAIFLLGLLAYLLKPANPEERNTQDNSPNNGLSDRQNTARLNARIPDVYGTVRSTPDLINDPYFVFEGQREVEFVYLCVGRGYYNITDAKDGETPVEDIAGISYEIYDPGESPNSGNAAVTFGNPIGERVWTAIKSNAVDGQILRAPDSVEITGDNDIGFVEPDQIVALNANQDIDFEEYFAEGDQITIEDSLTNGNVVDLDSPPGTTYTILSVEPTTITLANPGNVNPNWDSMFEIPDGTDAIIRSVSDKWVGPFRLEDAYEVIANFVADQGLYKINSQQKQFSIGVDIELEYTEIDKDGVPLSIPAVETVRLSGSAELQNQRNVTLRFQLPVTPSTFKNRFWEIRARRTNDKEPEPSGGRVVDTAKWRDLYSLGYVSQNDFGDVTTVLLKTVATSGALSVKERKWNCQASRLIYDWDENGDLSITRVESDHPGAIIRDIALDPVLGGMQESEIDSENFIAQVEENKAYFATDLAASFNHTFDDKDSSAEELILSTAKACHFIAYRQGGQLKLALERDQSISRLVFNHRNKIPGTELRTVSFGYNEDYDGVELDWVNPEDGSIETYRVPGTTETNPKKIETVGIQSEENAYIHAWREFNKIKYRREAVEFEATAEALTLLRNERVEIADNTRPDVDDGHCRSLDGLLLELSQPFTFEMGEDYVIHLSLFDKTVQVIDIEPTGDPYFVLLNQIPRLSLVLEKDSPNNPQWTPYQIVSVDNTSLTSFIVREMEPDDSFNVKVRAYNYDSRYYANDGDIAAGVFVPDTGVSILFRANFENFDFPEGEVRFEEDPDGLDSDGDLIEVMRNHAAVGPAAEGNYHIELSNAYQVFVDLTTDVEKDYELVMWYAGRPGFPGPVNGIELYWDGNLITEFQQDASAISNGEIEWQPVLLPLPTPTTTTTQLRFQSKAGPTVTIGGHLDDIRVKEIDNGQPTVFTPTSISGLGLWVDLSDPANVELDGVGPDADDIDDFLDQSGNSYDLYSPSNSRRAVYGTDGTGGYAQFTGPGTVPDLANERYRTPIGQPGLPSRLIFVVCDVELGGSNQEINSLFSSRDFGASPPPHDLILLNPNQYAGSEYPTGDYAVSFQGEGSGASGKLWVNGTYIGVGATVGSSSDIVTGATAVYAMEVSVVNQAWEIMPGVVDGDTGDGEVGFKGKIREILMYENPQTDFIVGVINQYLIDKWGITP